MESVNNEGKESITFSTETNVLTKGNDCPNLFPLIRTKEDGLDISSPKCVTEVNVSNLVIQNKEGSTTPSKWTAKNSERIMKCEKLLYSPSEKAKETDESNELTIEEPKALKSKLFCNKCSKRLGSNSIIFPGRYCAKCYETKRKEQENEDSDSILNDTLLINQMANEKRALAIKKGAFKDASFKYLNETIVIWNIRDFFSNKLWKEDILQHSKKRKKHHDTTETK